MSQSKLTAEQAEKLAIYNAIKSAMIAQARVDPAAFNEYVLAHEKTGRAIKNADFHREWQDFFTDTRLGVVIAPIEHGKTQQLIGRILWELGRDPDLRIILIGKAGKQSSKPLRLIKQHILYNKRLHEVFPNLRRSSRKGDPWTSTEIVVERSYFSKDPSIQARGLGSEDILGSRLDLIVFDDGLDLETTRTKLQRDNIEEWFDTILLSRLVEDYERKIFGRVFAIGTPFDSDDLLHRLAGRKAWRLANYSAVQNPNDDSSNWRPIWPEQWPIQRILDKRDSMTITAFARTILCRVLDDTTRRFKLAWINHMKWLGRERRFMKSSPTEAGRPMRCFTGLDIGVGKKKSDALTVFTTLAVTKAGRRVICDIDSGHWTGPEILDKCAEKANMFDSEISVEGNAAQRFIAEFAVEYKGVFATPVNTGREKWNDNFGVESLAVLMKHGMFIGPSGAGGQEPEPELEELCRECYDFNPEQHTGDRLMSLWVADKAVREYLEPRTSGTSDHVYR